MATTIQVSETTRQMLEMAKKKTGAKSLDETLQKVLAVQLDMPRSMFGSLKGGTPFTRRERLALWK